eukprot:SAG22_NODE_20816_length_262_cov_0.950920_2_plen_29_part_01
MQEYQSSHERHEVDAQYKRTATRECQHRK